MNDDIKPHSVLPSEKNDKPALPVDVVRVESPPNIVAKGLFILAVFYTLYFARGVLLPIVLALLLALILSPAVRALKRIALPEPVGAALVVASLAALLVSGVYQLFEPATEWLQKMPQIISQVERRLQNLRHSVAQVSKAAEQMERLATVNAKPKTDKGEVADQKPNLFNRVVGATQTFLISAASTVILLYFLLASGDMFLRKMVRVLDTFDDKRTVVGVARAIQSDMARYLFTITCINAGLGTLVGIALYLLGMPNPVLWGVMVALANYVPYVGSGTNLCILTVIAFLTFDHIERVLLVSGVYLGLQILEAQIVTPILTGRSLTLNPVVIFVSMLFWTWMWGVVGALIAVPLLMTLKIFCDHIESLGPVGEFLSGKREEIIGADPTNGA